VAYVPDAIGNGNASFSFISDTITFSSLLLRIGFHFVNTISQLKPIWTCLQSRHGQIGLGVRLSLSTTVRQVSLKPGQAFLLSNQLETAND
jgi:hypothetical protein